MNSNKALLERGIQTIGISVDQSQKDKLDLFLNHVLAENKKFNLTGIKDHRDAIVKHLLDSLSVSSHIKGRTVVDVGSGAGFPGIPLAITQPNKKIILVESKKKKAKFIVMAAKMLELQNTIVFDKRAEEVSLKQSADAIISRALGSLNYFVEKTKHMLKKDGSLYAMKGKNPESEIRDLNKAWTVAQIKKIDVPYLEAERHLITITRKHKGG
jgi:16S rRNA (guanine527-N7)-methyltransferase